MNGDSLPLPEFQRLRNEICNLVTAGTTRAVETVLQKYPRLRLDESLLIDCILAEYRQRKHNATLPDANEYYVRFPELRAQLREVLTESERASGTGTFSISRLNLKDLEPPRRSPSAAPTGDASKNNPQSSPERPANPLEFGVGTRFGEFIIQEKIGQGGMGAVYKALQTALRTKVALKVLSADRIGVPGAVERFKNEMKAVGAIVHENLVRALHAGTIDGTLFISMEYVEGTDLASMLTDGKVLTPADTCRVIRAVADALVAVHAAGLVHRDIKPSNILVDRNGNVKLADLGLAMLSGEKDRITSAGEVFGTPDYMAPEQWHDSGKVSFRADLYSLGCTMYHLLTGAPPYKQWPGLEQKRHAHLRIPAPDPRQRYGTLPDTLCEICLQLLAKLPEQRFESAARLMSALDSWTASQTMGGASKSQETAATNKSSTGSSPTKTQAAPQPAAKQRWNAGDTPAPESVTILGAQPAATASTLPTVPEIVRNAIESIQGNKNALRNSFARWQSSLLTSVTCPNCWHNFAPEDVLWISVSRSTGAEPQLPISATGVAEPLRFLPDRFDAEGKAIDAGGEPCTRLACPRCRLSIPRSSLELMPLIFSVVGTPGSGKSVFLAAQSYALETMVSQFGLAVEHADLQLNSALVADVNRLFRGTGGSEYQRIDEAVAKTSEQADPRWRASLIDGQERRFVPPYVYNLRHLGANPVNARGVDQSNLLCLYDNAGEHFRTGADDSLMPVTRHLARSNGIIFLFDPLGEPKVRNLLGLKSFASRQYDRQDLILNEAANRIREHASLSTREKIPQPIVVVLSKFDQWQQLLERPMPASPYFVHPQRKVSCLHLESVDAISGLCKQFLLNNGCDAVVRTAEDIAATVYYVPVASVGMSTEFDTLGQATYSPDAAQPYWAELPLAILLSKSKSSLVTWVRNA